MIPIALIHHWLLLHWPSVAGPGVGVIGIPLAILGQGLPTAERAASPEVTVRTHRSMPAA